jgi:hypothetical protein
MNDATSTPGEGDPLPASFLQKLQTGDSGAWQSLFAKLLPVTKEKIRHKFQLGTTDALDVQAALWSACTSFQRNFLDGELGDPVTLEDLAGQFVRIASNRWQRKKYNNRKWIKELRNANVRNEQGEWMPFNPPDSSPVPETEVIARELSAYIDEVIHQVLEDEEITSNPRKLEALRVYVADPSRRQVDIAELVKGTQSGVSRWIANFNERIRSMLGERDQE